MESSQPHCELELSVEFPGLEGFAVPLEDVGADDHDDYYSNYEQRQSPLPITSTTTSNVTTKTTAMLGHAFRTPIATANFLYHDHCRRRGRDHYLISAITAMRAAAGRRPMVMICIRPQSDEQFYVWLLLCPHVTCVSFLHIHKQLLCQRISKRRLPSRWRKKRGLLPELQPVSSGYSFWFACGFGSGLGSVLWRLGLVLLRSTPGWISHASVNQTSRRLRSKLAATEGTGIDRVPLQACNMVFPLLAPLPKPLPGV